MTTDHTQPYGTFKIEVKKKGVCSRNLPPPIYTLCLFLALNILHTHVHSPQFAQNQGTLVCGQFGLRCVLTQPFHVPRTPTCCFLSFSFTVPEVCHFSLAHSDAS